MSHPCSKNCEPICDHCIFFTCPVDEEDGMLLDDAFCHKFEKETLPWEMYCPDFVCQNNNMRIFLDDERETPKGWVRCYWPSEVIKIIERMSDAIEEISLDHDLGDDSRGTGYDVLLYLEEKVVLGELKKVPKLSVHSANSSARLKMEAAVKSIQKRLPDGC